MAQALTLDAVLEVADEVKAAGEAIARSGAEDYEDGWSDGASYAYHSLEEKLRERFGGE